MRTITPLTRAAIAASVAAIALGITGCSFTTTTPSPSPSADADESASSAPTAPASDGAEEQPTTPAPTTLAELITAFEEADVIDEASTYPLAFEGIASDAIGWDDGTGGYVEFYYVDLDAASEQVLANYEMAETEGTADYGGGILIPIDDVAGPFMIAYSASSDAAAIQARWEELTASL